jgi:hypothetical protein
VRNVQLYSLAAACAGAVTTMLAGAAAAAPLHQPLPVDSLEQNGEPQPMATHHPVTQAAPARASSRVAETPVHANAEAGLRRSYSGKPIDVLTYHYDALRTGWNQSETDLTPANVASASFGKLTTLKVDGNVFAQPLMVSKFRMPDGVMHDVLLIATGHNSVYAYDAKTYAVLWQVNLGASQSTADVGCADVHPEYGISSTPVIVRSGPDKATIYLVAATEPAKLSFHTQLHALDLGTGADVTPPVEIAPSAPLSGGKTIKFDPQNQWSRASLAFSKGSVYVGIGSHCDHVADSISGWMLRYDGAGLTLQDAFNTIEVSQGYELSSIWMTGFAPAIGAKGDLFLATGNGAFSQKPAPRDYGESILKLDSDLTSVKSTFTPADWRELNNGDVDLGSGGVMLLPTVDGQAAPPMAVVMGKSAILYLLDQDKLGGLKAGDTGALQALTVGKSGGGTWGGPAYYGSPSGGLVYAQINDDVLRAFSVTTGAKPTLTQVASGKVAGGYGGSLPIVSSNGSTAGSAVVWLIHRGATTSLEAYDATKLGAPLFTASTGAWSSQIGNAFLSPLEANGRVYAPGYQSVTVFGLTN